MFKLVQTCHTHALKNLARDYHHSKVVSVFFFFLFHRVVTWSFGMLLTRGNLTIFFSFFNFFSTGGDFSCNAEIFFMYEPLHCCTEWTQVTSVTIGDADGFPFFLSKKAWFASFFWIEAKPIFLLVVCSMVEMEL